MHILVYIVATFFIALAVGLIFSWIRERQTGTLFMAMAYGGAAGAAIVRMEWWPLLAGFVVAWAVRIAGLDPDTPRKPKA